MTTETIARPTVPMEILSDRLDATDGWLGGGDGAWDEAPPDPVDIANQFSLVVRRMVELVARRRFERETDDGLWVPIVRRCEDAVEDIILDEVSARDLAWMEGAPRVDISELRRRADAELAAS